jgi:hypothetical protein
MSYVSSNGPLPRNSQDPQTSCEAARAASIVNDMENAVNNAYSASMTIAGPNAFTSFGPAVVIDVARSQNAMAAAGLAKSNTQHANVAQAMMAAPIVLPLNVTDAEYFGCSRRGTDGLKPIPIAAQTITMPQPAPRPIVVPQVATAPQWNNLCWALRNGAVDASQFDPKELTSLQWRCTQMGYTGACVPPPNVALYLDQQRRAGTLPHISVSQGDLDAIPQAPDLGSVDCTQSWKLGGMAGYRRGMGAAWGDAGTMPSTPGWSTTSGETGWKAWLFFGVLGLGIYALAKD